MVVVVVVIIEVTRKAQVMEILPDIRIAASFWVIFSLSIFISQTKLKQKFITIKENFCFSHLMFKI